MRADRLLSLLMLLQSRGRMTAQQLAVELEVSVRTIYRDIDALSAAGVPVYAERGPGGGCDLLDSYRTTLTGLTDDEMSALFMLDVPAPLADLGVSQELKGALLKLSAAVSAGRGSAGQQSRDRVHLDSTWWFQEKEPVPHLRTIQQAIWQNRMLRVTTAYWQVHEIYLEQVIAPYGLVAKTSVWYLVWAAEGQVRARRVSNILDVVLLDETFERPAEFDLAAFWDEWCTEFESNRPYYPVTVRVEAERLPYLRRYFGSHFQQVGGEYSTGSDPAGCVRLTLSYESLFDARNAILSFGRAVEVLEPYALRLSVRDFASQICQLYENSEPAITS